MLPVTGEFWLRSSKEQLFPRDVKEPKNIKNLFSGIWMGICIILKFYFYNSLIEIRIRSAKHVNSGVKDKSADANISPTKLHILIAKQLGNVKKKMVSSHVNKKHLNQTTNSEKFEDVGIAYFLKIQFFLSNFKIYYLKKLFFCQTF